jgi:thioredoxin-related protein
MKIQRIIPLLIFIGCCTATAQTNSTTNVTVRGNPPPLYDESADGAKQIAAALDKATKEHKRVLLMFGANWCGWCHKLHTLFETDKNIADELKSKYVVAMIDMNDGHNGDLFHRYKGDYDGVPFLVVLEADGKYLLTQHTGVLEEGDHHSPQKVLAFLKEWAPK